MAKKSIKTNKNKIKTRMRHKKLGLAKFIDSNKPKRIKTKVVDEDAEITTDQHAASNKTKYVDKRNKKQSIVESMKSRMASSLLRLMDEELYHSDARNIGLDEEHFTAYHEAYANASDAWPVKPIDYIVKFIKKRMFSKRPVQKWVFADIGCGKEPLLRLKLPKKSTVHSFDIISTHKDVIEANMINLPLENMVVDCVVYSLSLMARNIGEVILEAKRVLRPKGSILIVEVTSRFRGREKKFIGCMHKLGFKSTSMSRLPPNDFFTFFHFTKTDNNMDYPRSMLGDLYLSPCSYKSR